jgi:polysaccharide biosynthesis transport protein
VVNAGMVPPLNRPSSPNVPLSFAAALAGGLFLGCAGALVKEATDASVRSVDELEHVLGVSLAGVVPEFGKPRRFGVLGRKNTERSGGVLEEGIRRSFALPLRGTTSQTVLITSAVAGDGKTRLAASLAVSLAQSGAKVLMVDADLLCPSLDGFFGVKATSGLTEALVTGGSAEIHACRQAAGLWLISAGGVGVDAQRGATGLLASWRMDALVKDWRSQYDFVLLDSAPVLPVPDAASLARFCDRTLLVVRYESTLMQAAQRSYRVIRQNLPEWAALDVVMNGVPENSPDYFAYYGHKGRRNERRVQVNA